MKLMSLAIIVNSAFQYVTEMSRFFMIDESHALKHSMEVFHTASKIYNSEVKKFPQLEKQKEIIYVSAIVHDMCDKKYMNEDAGMDLIEKHFREMVTEEQMKIILKIIATMSYSKVKKDGYPDLGEYQMAYHIVREADLLAAYDVDRCIIYSMFCEKMSYQDSVARTLDLFQTRVLKYRSDKLFVTSYSKNASMLLHRKALLGMEDLKRVRF
jgi:HD superfamily phosphodiesterase